VIITDIKTKRFLLRTLTKNDSSNDYLNWIKGSEYIENRDNIKTIEDLSSYISQKVDSDCALLIGIFLLSNGKHIGNIKYEPINHNKKYAVVGMLIGSEEWQGKKVLDEVLKPSASWLRKKHRIKKIYLGVNNDNKYAIKAFKKIGFTEDINARDVNTKIHLGMVLNIDNLISIS